MPVKKKVASTPKKGKKVTSAKATTKPVKSNKTTVRVNTSTLKNVITVVVGVIVTVLLLVAIDGFTQWYQIYNTKTRLERLESEVAALVNGDEILVSDVNDILFRINGQTQLESMILDKLWLEKATEQGLSLDDITEEEMNAQLEPEAERYGGIEEMRKLYEEHGVDFSEIEYQAKMSVLMEKIVAESAYVSDEELELFYQSQAQYGYDEAYIEQVVGDREVVREFLYEEKLKNEIQLMDQKLLAAADVENYVKDGVTETVPTYEFLKTYRDLWNKIQAFFEK